MIRAMPASICSWLTTTVALPSPERRLALPTRAIPTTQQLRPIKWYLLRERLRKVMAKKAANSISAPRIIWYTEAVTHNRPMFMRMVAIKSKIAGTDRNSVSLSSFRGSLTSPAGNGESCRRGSSISSPLFFFIAFCRYANGRQNVMPTNISVVIAHGLWKYFSVPSDPTLLSSYTIFANNEVVVPNRMRPPTAPPLPNDDAMASSERVRVRQPEGYER
mmetsp:Transcript_4407/g.12705  ORF Transcript_4407/g.12705 Transcript_4407/m.12705 type:complete len:219 (-) Transcript_4407:115-771(-)